MGKNNSASTYQKKLGEMRAASSNFGVLPASCWHSKKDQRRYLSGFWNKTIWCKLHWQPNKGQEAYWLFGLHISAAGKLTKFYCVCTHMRAHTQYETWNLTKTENCFDCKPHKELLLNWHKSLTKVSSINTPNNTKTNGKHLQEGHKSGTSQVLLRYISWLLQSRVNQEEEQLLLFSR